MSGHRAKYNQYRLGKYNNVTSFKLLELGDAYIALEQLVEYEDKAQLEAVELRFIRENPCVNRYHPGRTDMQYKAEVAYNKNTCQCGGQFTTNHKVEHERSKMHQRWQTTVAI